MQLPRFSPKGWFWGLTVAAFVWAYLGTRALPAGGQSFLHTTQDVITSPARLLAVPGSWIVTAVQHGITSTLHNFTATRQDTETVASLTDKLKKLEDDVAIRDRRIEMYAERLQEKKAKEAYGILQGDVVHAQITGRNAGAGSATISISRGTADGVLAGMPVLAGENCVIGRVMTADPKTAVVRLITDRKAMVNATISRRMPDGATLQVLKKPCLVQGQGNGEFTTDTIQKADAEIKVGDVVQLLDGSFPEKLQGFIIGYVVEVGTNPKQILRYEVRNRANINNIETVDVYIK